MSPCDYNLFCKLKELMTGLRFLDLESLNLAVTPCIRELKNSASMMAFKSYLSGKQLLTELHGEYNEKCKKIHFASQTTFFCERPVCITFKIPLQRPFHFEI